MNGMQRTQFDHASLDFLSLVIWSSVLTICHVKLTRSTTTEQQRFNLRSLSSALRNLWLSLVFRAIKHLHIIWSWFPERSASFYSVLSRRNLTVVITIFCIGCLQAITGELDDGLIMFQTIVKNLRTFQEIDFCLIANYETTLKKFKYPGPTPQPRSQDSLLPVPSERERERERKRRAGKRYWERGCQRPKILLCRLFSLAEKWCQIRRPIGKGDELLEPSQRGRK